MKHKAIIRLLKTEEGGRQTSPLTGYRPQLKIDDRNQTSTYITTCDGTEIIQLGKRYHVYLELQFESDYLALLDKSRPIELYEGSHLVGTGCFEGA
ncbi:hypothetical protein LJC63_02095 [Ruminococcaceae bacterium OttesenSCG-928-L11]|nr:hypothetical protein [Ruminococcaceae bacterium OttesenSCG-928-L11]